MSQALRNFAIDLLDDKHGINRQAYKTLADMLYDNDDEDIANAVKEVDGRLYLPVAAARALKEVEPKEA